MTVRESGRDAVMINCNPETVSTDYDTSDRLYFEPLTLEDVLGVVEVERPEGVIVQFGGQTPLKLAEGLQARRRAAARARAPRRSTSPRTAAASARCSSASATRRRRTRPRTGSTRRSRAATTSATRCSCARVRARRAGDGDRLLDERPARLPRAQRARRRTATGARSSSTASSRTRSRSTSTRSATARTSGSAGSCSTSRRPGSTPATRPACCRRTRSATRCSTGSASGRPASRSGSASSGLLNVQYAVYGGELYVIEANPRASRTVPFVSKAIGIPLAKIACRVMLGERLRDLDLPADPMRSDHVSVKEAVLPFDRFEGSDARARPGDALDRRGHGRRARLPGRVRQGAGGRRRARCPRRAPPSSP